MIIKPNLLSADPAEEAADIGMQTAETGAAPPNAAQRDALRESLEELAEIDEYAEEKVLPPPAAVAKKSARAFLKKVAPKIPRYYAVSPWEKGEVVVHTQSANGLRMDVFFNADGGASCYFIRPGSKGNEEHHYAHAKHLSYELIFSVLRDFEG